PDRGLIARGLQPLMPVQITAPTLLRTRSRAGSTDVASVHGRYSAPSAPRIGPGTSGSPEPADRSGRLLARSAVDRLPPGRLAWPGTFRHRLDGAGLRLAGRQAQLLAVMQDLERLPFRKLIGG